MHKQLVKNEVCAAVLVMINRDETSVGLCLKKSRHVDTNTYKLSNTHIRGEKYTASACLQ